MALSDIETIVVVMLENRSFDHMLGYLSLPSTPQPMAVEGLNDDPQWLEDRENVYGGNEYACFPLDPNTQTISDPQHDHTSIAEQINTASAKGAVPKMGGFVASYATYSNPTPPDPSLVMGYYDQRGVPIFDFFAHNFAVCDHWFASLPLGTQANRLMAMSGQSQILDNAGVFLPDQELVYDWLDQHGVSWCAYQSGDYFPFFSLMPKWLPEIMASLAEDAIDLHPHFRRYSTFARDWQTGRTPSVIFIEPEYTDGPHSKPNDDHSPTGVAPGQAFLADIYGALISNPERWAKTMMVVTYDEHGGFFDHVPPLAIPAQVAGQAIPTTGVRVPALIISPQVEPGSVVRGELDHTSILQLLVDKFAPTEGYSIDVDARQAMLQRLKDLPLSLQDPPPSPSINPAVVQSIQALGAAAAVAPNRGDAAGDPANTQAMHMVAVQAAQDHPEQMAKPGWQALSDHLRN